MSNQKPTLSLIRGTRKFHIRAARIFRQTNRTQDAKLAQAAAVSLYLQERAARKAGGS